MINFSTLGVLGLRSSDGTGVESVLSQPKRLAVLLYLALASLGGYTRRDTLLALFWPDSDAVRARNALSQTLSVLRKALGEDAVVTRGNEEVGLDPERIRCDAVAFDDALDAGRLEEALELYEGELAPGFHADASPEFDQWLEAERKRRRQAALAAALELAARAREAGRLRQAVAWARRAHSMAPLSEGAVRDLVETLAAGGDRTAALDVFEAFADRLASEYELEPSPDLVERVQAIAEGRIGPVPVNPEPMGSRPASVKHTERAAGPDRAMQTPSPGQDRGASREPFSSNRPGSAGRAATTNDRPIGWWTASRLAVVGAVAVLVIAGAVFATHSDVPMDSDRVAVVPFDDRSGRVELEGFGRVAAEWLTDGLVQAELGRVVLTATTNAVLERWRASHEEAQGVAEPARVVARETGARFVVTGAYYVHGEAFQVRAQVVDGRTGRAVDAMEAVTGPRDDPMAVLESVRDRVMGLVAARLDLSREMVDYAITPPSFEAYRHYSECKRLIFSGRSQWSVAIRECEMAADSAFLWPYIWMAVAYSNMPRDSAAKRDSILDILRARRAELPKGLRLHLDWVDAEPGSVLRRSRDLADLYGWHGMYGYAVGRSLQAANRQAEAVEAFERVDPEGPFVRGWMYYYTAYASALHMLGEHDQELEVLRRGRAQHPHRLRLLAHEAIALGALGRTEEAEAVIEEMLRFPGVSGSRMRQILPALGAEFLAHAQPEAAERTFRRGVRWFETRGDTTSPPARLNVGIMTLRLGELDEARRRFEAFRSAYPEDMFALTFLGVTAALQGDTARALQMEAELAALDRTYYFGTHQYLRAKILAALGDRKGAVALLRQAFSEGRSHIPHDQIDPEFANLRGYPPFEKLIRPKR